MGPRHSNAGLARLDRLPMAMIDLLAFGRARLAPLWPGLAAAAVLAAACSGDGEAPAVTIDDIEVTMQLTSPSFAQGSAIPIRYTCDGDDVSPALEGSGLPLLTGNAPPVPQPGEGEIPSKPSVDGLDTVADLIQKALDAAKSIREQA